jgi:hypothetical protein
MFTGVADKRMDFEDINTVLISLANDAMKGCGLSHDLYVKRFSAAVDREFRDAAPDVQAVAYQLAAGFDYATPEQMQTKEV